MATKIRTATGIAGGALGAILPFTAVNPFLAAGIAAGVGLVGLVDKIGQGRRMANKMTDPGAPQDIINKQLATIASSGASPEEKAQATEKAWKDFLGAANEFGQQGPTFAKVAQQAIFQTPELTNTVQSLMGGKNPLDPAYVSAAQQGIATGQGKPNEQPIASTVVSSALSAVPSLIKGFSTAGAGGSGGGNGGNGAGPWSVDPVSGEVNNTGGGGASTSILNQIFGKNPLSGILSTGTSLLSGIMQGRAAQSAATLQADAANKAAELEAGTAKNSLDFAKQVYGDQQKANAPFLTAGQNALAQIQGLIAPGGDLSADFTPPPNAPPSSFTMPTANEVRNTPGYQLQLDEALKALSRQTKGITSGATVKAAERFATDYGDTKYGDAVTRGMDVFKTNQGGYQNELNNALNVFNTNRSNRLNPLLQLAGFGPPAVATNNQSGNSLVNTNTGVSTTTAQDVGTLRQGAAFQTAGGNVASTNALAEALRQIANLQQQIAAQNRQSSQAVG